MPDKDDSRNKTLPAAGCQGQVEIPTPVERQYLDDMRAIKERVRGVKKRLTELKASTSEKDVSTIAELNQELARLKNDWTDLEGKWKAAVKERMIYLGHDEPD